MQKSCEYKLRKRKKNMQPGFHVLLKLKWPSCLLICDLACLFVPDLLSRVDSLVAVDITTGRGGAVRIVYGCLCQQPMKKWMLETDGKNKQETAEGHWRNSALLTRWQSLQTLERGRERECDRVSCQTREIEIERDREDNRKWLRSYVSVQTPWGEADKWKRDP